MIAFFASAPTMLCQAKPPLSIADLGRFPYLYEAISPDGKFACVQIGDKLRVTRTDGSGEQEFTGTAFASPRFTTDSGHLIWKGRDDSLAIDNLADLKCETVTGVTSSAEPVLESGDWVGYRRKDKDHALVLRNLRSGLQRTVQSVEQFAFDDAGSKVAVETSEPNASGREYRLHFIVFPGGGVVGNYASQTKLSNLTFDPMGAQMACVTGTGDSAEILLFNAATGRETTSTSASQIAPNQNCAIDGRRGMAFSPDGAKCFFFFDRTVAAGKPDPLDAKVDIWSYKDDELQSKQLQQLSDGRGKIKKSLQAVLDCRTGKALCLQQETDDLFRLSPGDSDAALAVELAEYQETWKRPNYRLYSVSTDDGTRKLIASGPGIYDWEFSPTGNYILYFDRANESWFVYSARSGETLNVSKNIPFPLYDEQFTLPEKPFPYQGISCWLGDGHSVLLRDRYDVWKVDVRTGAAQNLSEGLGRKERVRLVPLGIYLDWTTPVMVNGRLVVTAFNEGTKDDGFWSLSLSGGAPVQLSSEAAAICQSFGEGYAHPPIKARNADAYLIEKMSAAEAPNCFFTKDFSHYRRLSDSEPQKEFNWLKSELLRWKTFKAKSSEGVLYKPENFDPHKKYPVILYFYETYSDSLNDFINPELSNGPLNIPYFVSNGYLVFVPDIHYNMRDTANGAYDYIVSAAEMLAKQPWVHASKMGLQGHSWGAYEVNCVVTKTPLFAAAVECAGESDEVSGYSELRDTGDSSEYLYEHDQSRMGGPLWEYPDAYIKNSPIFHVDKVQTPILIMHNKEDGKVPWSQGIEWFVALRRLQKKAWMLQYDGEGHQLVDEKDQRDFTIRMKQFFDYYLEGAPAPKWMTEGIPATEKGVDSGLELDATGAKP